MDNQNKQIDKTNDLPIATDPPSSDNEFPPPSSDDQIRENYIEAIISALGLNQASSSSTTILPPFPYPPFTPRKTLPDKPPPTRPRRNPTRTPPEEPPTIPPPYPWAGDRRCRVCTLTYLHSQKMDYITGQVHCDKCDGTYEMQYNLGEKFNEIADYIHKNVEGMRHRAPYEWMNPALLNCRLCKKENSVSPVIPERKQKINWMFLVLGQMLGFCTLQQLKYFCRHTKNYLTGGEDVVLFRVYLELCRQLDPNDQGFSV